MHKGGFDSNESRTSGAYAPAQHSSSEWEELKPHFTAAGERCQETGAQTSAESSQPLHALPGPARFGVGSRGDGLVFWAGQVEETCFDLWNSIKLGFGSFQ